MNNNLVKLLEKAKGLGITPYKISQDTGIGQTSLGNYLRGERKIGSKNAKVLAQYFNVSVDYILDAEKEKPATPKDDELSENEIKLLAMYRAIPPDQRKMLYSVVEAALKSQGLL